MTVNVEVGYGRRRRPDRPDRRHRADTRQLEHAAGRARLRSIEGRYRHDAGAPIEGEVVRSVARERRIVSHTVTVVIPARNEANNIAWVLERMPSFVDEIVLVDGGSSDATVEVARGVRPDIVVVGDNGRGKGDAMRVGAASATGSLVVMIDADGSMDPAELDRFVEPLARGYEFVKGSRFLPGGGTLDMTRLRMLGNAGLNAVANLLFRASWSDLCYGYCGFRRSALEDLGLDADGFEIETQMVVRAAKAGLRTVEVPSFEYPRRFGNSNLNTFRDGFRVLFTILRERIRSMPPRLVPDERADA